jgi:hypothetical protein
MAGRKEQTNCEIVDGAVVVNRATYMKCEVKRFV